MTTNKTELFTELTAEQAASVEGGASLVIHTIKAIKSGENGRFDKTDDVQFLVNGKKLNFKKNNIVPGARPTPVNVAADFRNRAVVQVIDDDPRGHDKRAVFQLVARTRNEVFQTMTRSGGNSTYQMKYSVLNVPT